MPPTMKVLAVRRFLSEKTFFRQPRASALKKRARAAGLSGHKARKLVGRTRQHHVMRRGEIRGEKAQTRKKEKSSLHAVKDMQGR